MVVISLWKASNRINLRERQAWKAYSIPIYEHFPFGEHKVHAWSGEVVVLVSGTVAMGDGNENSLKMHCHRNLLFRPTDHPFCSHVCSIWIMCVKHIVCRKRCCDSTKSAVEVSICKTYWHKWHLWQQHSTCCSQLPKRESSTQVQ